MNVLSDSFSVLRDHWQLIAAVLLMMLLGQLLIGSLLRTVFGNRLASEEVFALSASGWLLPLSVGSILWLLIGTLLPASRAGWLVLLLFATLALALVLRARKGPTPQWRAVLWTLVALYGVFLFLRLAFLAKVIVPLYFDSAHHYLMVKSVLQSVASHQIPSPSSLRGAYYHTGFHLLTAWIGSTTQTDILNGILVLGQVIVAAIPFALFPIIKHETQSKMAGIFGILLASFGWYMPAYALNWGKYPALASLPLITFVSSLAYLSVQHKAALSRNKYLLLTGIVVLGLLITVLFHSRTLIVFALLALAWMIAAGWQRLPMLWRVIIFLAILIGTALIIRFVRTKDVFGLLFDPYWEKGVLVTAGVFVLAIFAQWRFPKLAFASILVILLLLGSLLVPVQVPGYGKLTLLDRPFVEMILYLPLSLLGGAGLSGLERTLQIVTARWARRRLWSVPYLSLFLIGALLVNAFANYNLYPSECCSIVGRDDLVAIDWVDKNLPADAVIGISSTELRVLDTDSPQGAAGGDAGAWITPFTGRTTIPLPYQSDFSRPDIFNRLCQVRAGYIYVGEKGATFNNELINAQPDRYKILLSMPKVKIYQVSGCSRSG